MRTGRGILFSALAQNLIDWSYAEAKAWAPHDTTELGLFLLLQEMWKGILYISLSGFRTAGMYVYTVYI